MFYLITMDCISIKYSVIPKISSVVLSLLRDAILIINDFLSDDLALSVLFVAVSFCIRKFFIVRCGPVFWPFAPVQSVPVLFFHP